MLMEAMDNLNTHAPGSLYEVFPAEEARDSLYADAWKLAEYGVN